MRRRLSLILIPLAVVAAVVITAVARRPGKFRRPKGDGNDASG